MEDYARRDRGGSLLGSALQALDAFPKTLEDFKERSTRGGWASVVIGTVISVLFFSEVAKFIRHEEVTSMSVDDSVGGQLSIFLDVDFPELPCNVLGIDAIDASGGMQLEIETDVYKTPINSLRSRNATPKRAHRLHRMVPEGLPENYCGSCYQAQGGFRRCCNTCADVKAAYQEQGLRLPDMHQIEQCVRDGQVPAESSERVGGCNIRGLLHVAKVAGTFHISPGHTYAYHGMAVHDISSILSRRGNVNLTHEIHRFSFGTPSDFDVMMTDSEGTRKAEHARKQKVQKVHWNYETTDPLNQVTKIAEEVGQYEYFLRVVPTVLRKGFHSVSFEQYSVTEMFRPVIRNGQLTGLPGLFFRYDMNPIKVEVVYQRPNLFHFFVRTSAIVGGVFATAKLVNKAIGAVVDTVNPARKTL